MKYLHTMVRVTDVDTSLKFYVDALGLEVLSRKDYPQGKFTLIFLAAPGDSEAQVELTHNWEPEPYGGGRNFGHLAYAVDDIYATRQRLQKRRDHQPPAARWAHGLVRSPDNISIEHRRSWRHCRPPALVSMANTGVVAPPPNVAPPSGSGNAPFCSPCRARLQGAWSAAL
jgi:lactoylglutathione lyase